jgi:hypothetical protein
MRKIGAVLAAMFITVSAHAVQTVTLQDVPPLKPLNWCKHADGTVAPQADPCGPGTTAVSSEVEISTEGEIKHLPLEGSLAPQPASQLKTDNAAPANKPAGNSVAANQPNTGTHGSSADFWKSVGKWLGFAVVVGLLAKLLSKSFWSWFVVGLGVRAVLVALNVMRF